jgi:hypothetical protein
MTCDNTCPQDHCRMRTKIACLDHPTALVLGIGYPFFIKCAARMYPHKRNTCVPTIDQSCKASHNGSLPFWSLLTEEQLRLQQTLPVGHYPLHQASFQQLHLATVTVERKLKQPLTAATEECAGEQLLPTLAGSGPQRPPARGMRATRDLPRRPAFRTKHSVV